MAKITVEGTATRIFFEDRGVEVTEVFKTRDGVQAQRKYTAWFEAPVDFREGATGIFTGLLSTVIDDWVDRQTGQPKLNNEGKPGRSIKTAINGAKFEATGYQTPAAPTHNIPIDDMPF
jgi:hypothetical protein